MSLSGVLPVVVMLGVHGLLVHLVARAAARQGQVYVYWLVIAFGFLVPAAIAVLFLKLSARREVPQPLGPRWPVQQLPHPAPQVAGQERSPYF